MSERPPASSLDRSRIDPVIEPIARAHGAEIFDIELKSEASGWVLRVYVEKLGSAERKSTTQDAAVDLTLCSNVAKELSPALDVIDIVPHRYHLEVSSPGLERPLRHRADFERFEGQKAKIKLRTPIKGQKVLVARLAKVHGDVVTVEEGSKSYDVPLADIVSSHLVFEFGPAPKPGKQKKGPSPR